MLWAGSNRNGITQEKLQSRAQRGTMTRHYNTVAITEYKLNVPLSQFYFVCIELLQLLERSADITKTRLYNFDPLKPHFYIVKLGFTGVYIIFLISAQNIDCGYSLEPPRRGGSNEYPQSMFWAETWKISEFFIWNFSGFFRGEIFYIFE